MKIECELCHATAEMADVAPRAGGGMDVKCGICGRWFAARAGTTPVPVVVADRPSAASSTRAAAAAAPVAAGPSCPKCGRARGAAAACPRCGLVFENWTGPPAAGASLDERAESLWLEVEQSWTLETAHDAFMVHCQGVGLLGAAGRRYRERLDREPGEPMATRMQQRILNLATQLLGGHATVRPPITRSTWFAVVVVATAILGAAAGLAFSR